MTKVVIFSSVNGQIFSHGYPVAGAQVTRSTEYKELHIETTTTDAQGRFQFPDRLDSKKFTLFPSEFVVAQAISVKTSGGEYQIWSNTKRSKEVNAELGGAKLNLTCNLQDGLKIYKDFGSILRTNCRWDSGLKSNSGDEFIFSEHLLNVDWLKALPKGMLSEKVDLKHYSVMLEKTNDGHTIYVGPKNPDQGGEGLTVWLGKDLKLINYEVERLEPIPFTE